MKQMEQIYCNDFGMAFYWTKQNTVMLDRIQLVFKETGFYFSVDELKAFVKLIDDSCRRNTCNNCEMKHQCAKFLLKTPISQIDLAVSMTELDGIKDLVAGTLFKINVQEYIYGVGMN